MQNTYTDLSSAAVRQLDTLLLSRSRLTGFFLNFEDYYQSCIRDGYVDKSPEQTRAYIAAFFAQRSHLMEQGKTLKGETGHKARRGAF
jgi:hypothetical protein